MQRIGDSAGFTRWQAVVARNMAEAAERALAGVPTMHHKLTDRKEKEACALCGGGRFVRKEVPVGHPDFGGVTSCPSCGGAVFIHTDAKRMLMPRDYWGMTFEAWRSRNQHTSGLMSTAMRFLADTGGFLYLCGSAGTGKTHMAAAMVNRLIEQGYPARFTTAVQMAADCRAAVAAGSNALQSVIDRYLKVRFLVIDDLGTEHGSAFIRDVLYQVVDGRYRSGARFVITSNYTPEELGEARLASRLRDVSRGHVKEVFELDYRGSGPEATDGEETF